MKKYWWKVPVYCMAASWVCFQMEVHFLGKWTIVTLPDGSISSDNIRWLILSAVLFLAVVCIGGFFFLRKMTRKEIFFQPVEKVRLGIMPRRTFSFEKGKIAAKKNNRPPKSFSASSPERDFSVSISKWLVSSNSWQQI